MKKHIDQKLAQIAQTKNIHILYACESGSRAWGFASPNSDFDVRFIYRANKNDYLAINEPSTRLTFPLDEHELDLAGWDLKKCLNLLKKSNSTIFEWLQSPIIYSDEDHFKTRLWSICSDYFDPKTNINHYLGIANTAYKSLNNAQIPIKKLFYVLRPILAAKWCMNRKTIAPMSISELMVMLPENLHDQIHSLITRKKDLPESYLIPLAPELTDFFAKTFTDCRAFANELAPIAFDDKILNDFFLNELSHDD